MILILNTVQGRVTPMPTSSSSNQDGNTEVAHLVVIPHIYPRHLRKNTEETPDNWEKKFPMASLKEHKETEEAPEIWEDKFLGSADEIAKAQHDEPDIHSVITQMKEGGPRPTAKELQTVSHLTREVWAQYPLLELKDNVLRLKPKDEEKDFKSRGILPECLVKPDLKRSNPK